mmetsp:Transcript_2588/g.4173  ORF Transcript_2588/g.4173 Transcript_2588/m.4173 type:complete len:454 (-) Transcript_2588:298-1659(-)
MKGLNICSDFSIDQCILDDMIAIATKASKAIGVYVRVDMFLGADNSIHVQEYSTNHMNGLRHCSAKLDENDCIDPCFQGRMWKEAGGNSAFGGPQLTLPPQLEDYMGLATDDEKCDNIKSAIVPDAPFTTCINKKPPVAMDDSVTTEENTSIEIEVLTPDGDNSTYVPTIPVDPSSGSVVVNPNGTITYTPDPGFVGTDSFVYEICDVDGQCDTATVTVTTTEDPKLALYSGVDTANITTHTEAVAFCEEKGLILATEEEWCSFAKSNSDDQYGITPISGSNDYIDVGDTCGPTPAPTTLARISGAADPTPSAPTPAPTTLAPIVGPTPSPTTSAPTPAPTTLATESPTPKPAAGFSCNKPPNCFTQTCAIDCSNVPVGYYPDAADCSAYCFCTGTSAPSRWERVHPAPALLWDAYCGGSQPLDPNNVPLGGMTGGCANWDSAAINKSHCAVS